MRSGLPALSILIVAAFFLNSCATSPSTITTDLPETDPNIDRCFTLTEAGQYTAALPACEAALAKNPESFIVHASYARSLAETGDAARAEAEYKQALSIQPDAIKTREEFGDFLNKSGRISEAIQEYKVVERLKTDYPDILVKIGRTLGGLQRHTESAEYFQKALTLQPDRADLTVETPGRFDRRDDGSALFRWSKSCCKYFHEKCAEIHARFSLSSIFLWFIPSSIRGLSRSSGSIPQGKITGSQIPENWFGSCPYSLQIRPTGSICCRSQELPEAKPGIR